MALRLDLGQNLKLWRLGEVGLHRDPGLSLGTRISWTREVPPAPSFSETALFGLGKNNLTGLLAVATPPPPCPSPAPPMLLGRVGRGTAAEWLEASCPETLVSGSGCMAASTPGAPSFPSGKWCKPLRNQLWRFTRKHPAGSRY